MSFETRFSPEEQSVLISFPNMIGSAMAFAEGSGLGTVKEMIATSRSFLKGREIQDNEIISGVMPQASGFSDAMKESKEMGEAITDRLKSRGAGSRMV